MVEPNWDENEDGFAQGGSDNDDDAAWDNPYGEEEDDPRTRHE